MFTKIKKKKENRKKGITSLEMILVVGIVISLAAYILSNFSDSSTDAANVANTAIEATTAEQGTIFR